MVQKSNDHHLVCPKPVANSRGKLPSIWCRISTINSISSLVELLGIILQPGYIGIRRSRCSSLKNFTKISWNVTGSPRLDVVCWNTAVSMFGRLASGIQGLVCILWKVRENRDLLLNVQCKGITLPMKSATDLKENLEFLILCEL